MVTFMYKIPNEIKLTHIERDNLVVETHSPDDHLLDVVVATGHDVQFLKPQLYSLFHQSEESRYRKSWSRYLEHPDHIMDRMASVNRRMDLSLNIAYLRCDLVSGRLDRAIQGDIQFIGGNCLKGGDTFKVVDSQKELLFGALKSLRAPNKRVYESSFMADLSMLPICRNFISEICNAAGQSKIALQMALAVNEAFSNIVLHGRCDGVIRIEVEADDGGMTVRILDQTEGFDPLLVPYPHFSGENGGGFGLFLIQNSVDHISYRKRGGDRDWNCLTLYKYQKGGDPMEICCESANNRLIITLQGASLDVHVVSELKEKIKDIIEKSEEKNIIIDLVNVDFLDSSGFGSLIILLKVAKSKNRDLELANLSKQVEGMFHMLNLDKLFKVTKRT